MLYFISILFSEIKMEEENSFLKTPQKQPKGVRTANKIISIANANKHTEEQSIPFSFRMKDKHPIEKKLQEMEKSIEKQKMERSEATQKKIKLVSASFSPQQNKTVKKKYIKLFIPKHLKEEDDQESLIADEKNHHEVEQGIQEVRASLDYFEKDKTAPITHHLQRIAQINEINIQEEERIAMLSQMNSTANLCHIQKEEEKVEPEAEADIKSKRKIILSHHYRNKKQTQPQPQIQSQAQNYISQTFRYCIGCHRPILEANTLIHEKQCTHFQDIYQMSYPQITHLLKNLTTQLARSIDRIKSSFSAQDLYNLKYYTEGLLRETEIITARGTKTKNYNDRLQEQKEANKKWLLLAEEISKLNWFITLRQTIREQTFQKQ